MFRVAILFFFYCTVRLPAPCPSHLFPTCFKPLPINSLIVRFNGISSSTEFFNDCTLILALDAVMILETQPTNAKLEQKDLLQWGSRSNCILRRI
jgi:hypothetical protein